MWQHWCIFNLKCGCSLRLWECRSFPGVSTSVCMGPCSQGNLEVKNIQCTLFVAVVIRNVHMPVWSFTLRRHSALHIVSQPYVPILTLSALLSCDQWPLMSILAQADCNYQTGWTSRLINTLTSSSQPTRAYSAAKRGSDNFIPHLSPDTHMHLCVHLYVCFWVYNRVQPVCTEGVNRAADGGRQS